jgi:putative endonuclease
MASQNTKATAPAFTRRLFNFWARARSIVAPLRLFASPADHLVAPNRKKQHGQLGEASAARFLRTQGYKILVTNYSSRWGEIDIVCRHRNVLVFVEVKTRGENAWGNPAAAVTRSKQRRLILTAHAYLKELEDNNMPCRFDVVEVYLEQDQVSRCELIPAAFDLPVL